VLESGGRGPHRAHLQCLCGAPSGRAHWPSRASRVGGANSRTRTGRQKIVRLRSRCVYCLVVYCMSPSLYRLVLFRLVTVWLRPVTVSFPSRFPSAVTCLPSHELLDSIYVPLVSISLLFCCGLFERYLS
jgi:hypothetical protein